MAEKHKNTNAGTTEIDKAWKENERRVNTNRTYSINNNIKFYGLDTP